MFIQRLNLMTIENLIEDSISSVPFHQQVLVTMCQSGPHTRSNKKIIPTKINEIIAIARNRVMNVYTQDNLHRNLHFSTSLLHLYVICLKLYTAMGLDHDSRLLPITFVSAHTKNFMSPSKSLIVQNYVQGENNDELEAIRMKILSSCSEGLLKHFSFEKSKRTVSALNQSIKEPSIHTGYTRTNAHQYQHHRSTQLGHTHPNLIMGYLSGASTACRRALGCALAMANSLVHESPRVFKIDEEAPSPYRLWLRQKYHNFFGFDTSPEDQVITNFINHEANSILSAHRIKAHFDEKNDPLPSMSGVVSTLLCIDRNEEFFKDTPELNAFLDKIGYTDYMPYGQISYSRKVCYDASSRPDFVRYSLETKNDGLHMARRALAEAITDVNSPANYLNTYDNLDGVQYHDVITSIDDFNRQQSVLAKTILMNKKDVYQDFRDTMGHCLSQQIDDWMEQQSGRTLNHGGLQANHYDWKLECFDIDGGQNAIRLPDPTSTFQGPTIKLQAAYDKMVRNTHICIAFNVHNL